MAEGCIPSCTFDCLFGQNWQFRDSFQGRPVSSEELAGQVEDRTHCICYFGGDPSSQMPHAIKASRLALNPDIPYSLLTFHPQFFMKDLPVTSRSQARACLKAARDAGLKNIQVGNIHLIQDDL